jgi:hypothetical protein
MFNAKIGMGVAIGLLSLNAFADTANLTARRGAGGDVSEAGRMHVQISNLSGENCSITVQQLLHGTLDSLPPQTLMVNESKAFDMLQAGFGPDMIIGYLCGDKSARFEVQQDYAFIMGHTPHVTILESHGLKIAYEATGASAFWGNPGLVNITLLNSNH